MAGTWKSEVLRLVAEFCDRQGSRTFTLKHLWAAIAPDLGASFPNNNNQQEKLRQTLQFLRDDGMLHFVDGRGTYTLCGLDLLANEVAQPLVVQAIHASLPDQPTQREYWTEVYARERGLVSIAKTVFGTRCLCVNCNNSFLKEDGSPYCEVHHIQPLCVGGEDTLSNLSVLCAHHHKMAHFATLHEQAKLQNYLRGATNEILTACNTNFASELS